MGIPERFTQYLHEQALCQSHDRILLAVSGGKDSVLMAHLFADAGYAIGIAHCNFQLRGDESDADEALVCQLAKRLDVPLYVTRFDTRSHAKQRGISTQMAARELRYDWFETIRASQGYDYLAVAQHQNDHIETLLLNLVRGTGLAGLRGIHAKRDTIIRPLRFLRADEIAEYVHRRGLGYRDDLSNFSTDYARNKIRLEVVPRLKELNPDLENVAARSMARFADAYAILQGHVAQLRSQLFFEDGGGNWRIPIADLTALEPQVFLLYELFSPFGFTEAVLTDLAKALPAASGKQFNSSTHRLYVDREDVLLVPIMATDNGVATIGKAGDDTQWGKYRFESSVSADRTIRREPNMAQFDADKIVFPLCIRAWQEGDSFVPLGMKGHKKLSDFFVSLKIPVYRKHSIPIVVNGNGDIIWVAPYRMDDGYKIVGGTKKVLTLACF